MTASRWRPAPEPGALAADLAARFAARYGHRPDGVWAAPGRVTVIGEHVDYQAGLCLAQALPHRTAVALARRPDERVRLVSAQLPGRDWEGSLAAIGPGRVPGWAGYAAGVPWALRQEGFTVPGFDALVDSSVPVGSGLSSSAALECAVALALDELAGLGLGGDDAGRARLAAACVRAENEVAGAPTGGLDQAGALRTTAGRALLIDCRDFSVAQVPFDLAGAGLELLVMDTRAHHALVDGQYGSRRQTCADAARILGVGTLRELTPEDLPTAAKTIGHAVSDPGHADELTSRVRHVVTEIARVREVLALARAGTGELARIGPVLDASHASLRDDYQVSCAELDLACEVARAEGALGARMVGGGFGGSAIALVPSGSSGSVATAVTAAFGRAGYPDPEFLIAAAAGPGSRVL